MVFWLDGRIRIFQSEYAYSPFRHYKNFANWFILAIQTQGSKLDHNRDILGIRCYFLIIPVVDAAKRMVSRLPFRIKTIEITEGNQSLKLDSFMIKPFMVDHKTPCFGYQFQLSRAGRFSEELAKQNNVPEEIWSEIQQKNIVPYNGRIYTQDLIMDIPRKGLKFVYVTDTRLCESMRIAAKGADLMICEGMYYELPKTGNAANNYHMTMIEAASLAASSGVKEMILTHFSPSIIDPTIYSDRLHGICKNITIGTDGMVRTLQYKED